MKLSEVQKEAHEIAIEKGWWRCPACGGRGSVEAAFDQEYAVPHYDHCRKCNGTGRHRNEGELLALVHSEVSEALEALRKGKHAISEKCAFLKRIRPSTTEVFENHESELAEELADIVIRVMDYAEYKGIDLEKAIAWKLKYNRTRPHRHGKKF